MKVQKVSQASKAVVELNMIKMTWFGSSKVSNQDFAPIDPKAHRTRSMAKHQSTSMFICFSKDDVLLRVPELFSIALVSCPKMKLIQLIMNKVYTLIIKIVLYYLNL